MERVLNERGSVFIVEHKPKAKKKYIYSLGSGDMALEKKVGRSGTNFYTSTKSWRGYIFTADCLCVCVSVCLSACLLFSCEQNSSRMDVPIWTRFSLNGCLPHRLEPY